MTGSAGQKRVPASYLRQARVPLVGPPEQRRIANILEKADAIRHRRREAIAATEQLLRSAFLALFGDPVLNPKGWPSVRVEDLCSHVVDCLHTTPKYTGTQRLHPCIRTSDLQGGFFDWSTTKYVSTEEYEERVARLTPVAGDVFYTREGERFGIAAILPQKIPACLGQRMMVLRVDKAVATPEFLWATMNSSAVYRQAVAEVGGSTSPHVNVKSIRRFRTVCPPMSLQREYSKVYQGVMHMRSVHLAANASSETLFASLLEMTFGRVATFGGITC
jgi:type I restriction enzyme S subunit